MRVLAQRTRGAIHAIAVPAPKRFDRHEEAAKPAMCRSRGLQDRVLHVPARIALDVGLAVARRVAQGRDPMDERDLACAFGIKHAEDVVRDVKRKVVCLHGQAYA